MVKDRLISVIMPVYNIAGSPYLKDALKSIAGQRHQALEIVVVDDGSMDNSGEVIKKLISGGTLSYIYQDHAGVAAARNSGIRKARGNIIAFLDADDLWPDGRLKKHYDLLTSERGKDIVLGLTQIYMKSKERKTNGRGFFENVGKPYLSYNLGSALFQKSVFSKVGLFSLPLSSIEDFDWFMRAREAGVSIAATEETSLIYRLHESNMSPEKRKIQENVLGLLHSSIKRRKDRKKDKLAPFICPDKKRDEQKK